MKFVVLVAGVTALASGLATVAQVKAQDDVNGRMTGPLPFAFVTKVASPMFISQC